MSLIHDLLGQDQGDQAINQISQQVGEEPSLVQSAVNSALPMILGSMASNAATPDGAESLNSALDQHDGSVLGSLEGLAGRVFAGQGSSDPQADGGGILSHIFGTTQGQAAQQISNQTGMDTGKTAQILMMLAPIIMGYLGQQKQQQGVGADGIGSMIGGLLGGGHGGSSWMDIATGMLDRDHDGGAVDDIASMAMNYFRNK